MLHLLRVDLQFLSIKERFQHIQTLRPIRLLGREVDDFYVRHADVGGNAREKLHRLNERVSEGSACVLGF